MMPVLLIEISSFVTMFLKASKGTSYFYYPVFFMIRVLVGLAGISLIICYIVFVM